MSTSKNDSVALYESGEADDSELNGQITKIWTSLLAEKRAEISKELDCEQGELNPTVPPFKAETRGSGFAGADIVILIATGFFGNLAKETGAAASKLVLTKLKTVWDRHVEPRLNAQKNRPLGKRKNEDD